MDPMAPKKSLCPYCDSAFGSYHALKTHVGIMHKEEAPEFLGRGVPTVLDDQNEETIINYSPVGHVTAKGTARKAYLKSMLKRSNRQKFNVKKTLAKPSIKGRTPGNGELQCTQFSDFTYTEVKSRSDTESHNEPGTLVPIGDLILCPYCQEDFYDEKYLEKHIRHEHIDVSSAGIRENDIVSPWAPIHHMGIQMPDNLDSEERFPRFQCSTCSKQFYNKGILKRHISTFHPNHGNNTSRANKWINATHQVDSTVKRSRNTRSAVTANITGITHVRSGSAAEAYPEGFICENQKPLQAEYRCPFCPLKIISQNDHLLGSHVKKDHKNLRQNIKCRYCSRILRTKGHLLSHLRTHTHEQPFQCALCEKRFRQGYQKLKHERKIHGEIWD